MKEKRRAGEEEMHARYLLGELAEEEQTDLELQYLDDEEVLDGLLASEADLADAYARGELNSEQQARFERHLLSRPRGRQRVEFARALRTVLSEAGPHPLPIPALPGGSWLRKSLKRRSALLSLAAAVLLLLAGAWLAFDSLRLREDRISLREERVVLQRRVLELERQSAAERARIEELAGELARRPIPSAPDDRESARPIDTAARTVSFLLSSQFRDPVESNEFVVPPDARKVALELELESDLHEIYQTVIKRVSGEKIWSREDLRARSQAHGKTISIAVPADLLAPGDYILVLSGRSAARPREGVGQYSFRIARNSSKR